MKKLLFVALTAISIVGVSCSERYELEQSLKAALEVAVEQDKAQAEVMLELQGEMPKSF